MTAEFAETAPPPFNRDACVRQTVAEYHYPLLGIITENDPTLKLEPRYLEGDFYADGDTRRIRSVDTWIASVTASWEDPAAALTPEGSEELLQGHRQRAKEFGGAIVAHGRQHDIVTTMTTAEASQEFAVDARRLSDGKDGCGTFSQGWAVFKNSAGEPVLLMPAATDDGGRRLETVSLDELYRRDPAAVQEQLRTYHRHRAAEQMVWSAMDGVASHEAITPEVIPEFLRPLKDVPDSAERQWQVEQGIGALQWIAPIVENLPSSDDAARRFHSKIREVVRVAGRYSMETNVSLHHMATCAGETLQAQQDARELLGAYNTLYVADFGGDTSFTQSIPGGELLVNPVSYAVYTPYHAARHDEWAAVMQQEANFAAFAEHAQAMETPGQLLEAMEQALPETYETLMRFREALDTNEYGGPRFERLLAHSVQPPYVMPGSEVSGSDMTLYELRKRIGRQLGREMPLTGIEFEGVISGEWGREMYIHNPHLEFALPLLVIASAVSRFTAEAKSFAPGDYSRERHAMVRQWQSLGEALPQEYRKRRQDNEGAQQRVQERVAALAAFQAEHAVTDAELGALYEGLVSTDPDVDAYDNRPKVHATLYTAMFNVLYLAKYGRIDLRSDFQRKLVAAFVGRNQEERAKIEQTWQGLAAVVQPKPSD